MIMAWEAKLEAMHMHKYEAICSFMTAEMCKSAFKKHINTKQQNQNQPAIS